MAACRMDHRRVREVRSMRVGSIISGWGLAAAEQRLMQPTNRNMPSNNRIRRRPTIQLKKVSSVSGGGCGW